SHGVRAWCVRARLRRRSARPARRAPRPERSGVGLRRPARHNRARARPRQLIAPRRPAGGALPRSSTPPATPHLAREWFTVRVAATKFQGQGTMTEGHSGKAVAIVGATGAVGEVLLNVLEERRFPLRELRPLASSRSAGLTVQFAGKSVAVQEARPE